MFVLRNTVLHFQGKYFALLATEKPGSSPAVRQTYSQSYCKCKNLNGLHTCTSI